MSEMSLKEIANLIDGVIIGDESITVSSLSSIDEIKPNTLVFANSNKNLLIAEESSATAILVNQDVTSNIKPVIQSKNPLKALIEIINYFNPEKTMLRDIHPTAIIAKNVILGKNIYIGPNVVIGEGTTIEDNTVIKSNVVIGENVIIRANTVLYPQVTIYDNTKIGRNVTIHASSVIGCDGFGYTFMENKHVKIPHVGDVIIEDEVEIGANSVIDRATLGSTKIGKGTKIDNLVQIAHSVKLGKNNILCAFTGIAGSTVSGDEVIFAANVGVSDHVTIEDNVILGARAGVPSKKVLNKDTVYLGNPARPKEKALQQELSVTKIPFISKKIKSLSKKIEELTLKIEEILKNISIGKK